MRKLIVFFALAGCAGRAPIVDDGEQPSCDNCIEREDVFEGELTVLPDCPVAVIDILDAGVSYTPFDTAHLTARNSVPSRTGSPIVDAEWQLDIRPATSRGGLEVDGLDAELPFDSIGAYQVRLHVVDADGVRSCEAATLAIDVASPGDVWVRLTWDHPQADLDLHTIRTGGVVFSPDDDVYFSNREPALAPPWSSDAAENPRLEFDDDDGYGPETMLIERMAIGSSYTIAVHYWNAHTDGDARAPARLDAFLLGEHAITTTHAFDQDEQLWFSFRIDWPQGDPAPSIFVLDAVQDFARPF